MDDKTKSLIEKLESEHHLELGEYEYLIAHRDQQAMDFAAERADCVRREIYGTDVYVRGLIEFSNYCKNDCLYC